jgi:hypothetical protein
MDESSADLRDEHGKVEGSFDLGGGPGHELQAPDGERREGMVWESFVGLNETFGIDGTPGMWVDRYMKSEPVCYGPVKGSKQDREHVRRRSEAMKKHFAENQHHISKPVTVDGVTYPSQLAGARALNIKYHTFRRRYVK